MQLASRSIENSSSEFSARTSACDSEEEGDSDTASRKSSRPRATSSTGQDSWVTAVGDEDDGGFEDSSNTVQVGNSVQASTPGSPQENLELVACFRRLLQRGELYRGVTPIVATIAISNFIFFYVNELMKRLMVSPNTSRTSSQQRLRLLIASCMAGVVNVLLTNPLWVTNLRIVAGDTFSESLLVELYNAVKNHGLAHLWKGTSTSILLVSNPVIQFFVYEQLRNRRVASRRLGDNLTALEAFWTGAVAKTIATIMTYPLQLTQAVLRMQGQIDGVIAAESTPPNDHGRTIIAAPRYLGTWDCIVKLYRRGGVEGIFTGMRAKMLQTVLTASFTFLTYEQILGAVQAAHLAILAK
jgi:adenine nucleotide transporter 17